MDLSKPSDIAVDECLDKNVDEQISQSVEFSHNEPCAQDHRDVGENESVSIVYAFDIQQKREMALLMGQYMMIKIWKMMQRNHGYQNYP